MDAIKAFLLSDCKHSFFALADNDPMENYGARLKHALKVRGKSRADLAQKLEITVQAVGQVIRGETNMFDAVNHSRACAFLNCSPLWLACREGDEPREVDAQNVIGFPDFDANTQRVLEIMRAADSLGRAKIFEAVIVASNAAAATRQKSGESSTLRYTASGGG